MRIAFFVQYSSLNGTYFRWHNLAIALQKAGHVVDVYAGDHNWKSNIRYEKRDGIDYYLVPAFQTARIFYSPNDIFSSIRRLGKRLPKKEYDIYHLFQPFLQAYIPWSFLKRKKKKAVFLYDWDDLWTGGLFTKPANIRERYYHGVTSYLEKKIPSVAEAVTVCSGFLNDRIVTGATVKKIYNGFWPQPVPEKEKLRSKWQLQDNVFYLGYVGKTADELDWITEALTFIRSQKFNEVKLVVCGPPASFMQQSGYLKNPDIIYLGELSPADAREIATAVDLGLIPLENTPFNQSRFPIKFFDFLTVNTPVYLSGVGEVAAIGKTIPGVFRGPSNKTDWVKELIPVIQQLQKQPVNINVHALTDHFSWPAIARDLEAFYSLLLTKKK